MPETDTSSPMKHMSPPTAHTPLRRGGRWREGRQGGVEAKEGVKIQAENQTLAPLTSQN